jgi:hypothetical protein
VNISRGKREHAEAERPDGSGGGAPGRRSVLGGIAALPVLYGVGSAAPALAAAATRPASVPAAAGDLVRGTERRYNAPLLTPGTRLVLPAGLKAVSGFTEGWYELTHASGRADRVMWDASKLPHLFVYGEFGGTDEEPFRDRFYTLALQPMSRNPYLRSTIIL